MGSLLCDVLSIFQHGFALAGVKGGRGIFMKKAIVAVSRKLATILLAMWKSGTAYWAKGKPTGCAADVATA